MNNSVLEKTLWPKRFVVIFHIALLIPIYVALRYIVYREERQRKEIMTVRVAGLFAICFDNRAAVVFLFFHLIQKSAIQK